MKTNVTSKSLLTYLLTYLLTGMLVLVGNETISAQTYQTRIDCGSPNCEIVIDFAINAVEDNTGECGLWNLSTSYNVVSDPCNKLVSIQNFRWKNITSSGIGVELYGETVHGQNVSYQLPYSLTFQMQLIFSVTTNCSGTNTSTYSHNFQIVAEEDCGWCSSSFCLSNTHCDVGSEQWRVDFCTGFKLWNGKKSKPLNGNQNFDFPYIFYQTWPCQFSQYSTYLDLVDDMNQYFNGIPADESGYAVIKYIEIGDPEWDPTYLCKIKFILRSSNYVIRELGLLSRNILNNCVLDTSYPPLCSSNTSIFNYDNAQCLPGPGMEVVDKFIESDFTNSEKIQMNNDQNIHSLDFDAMIFPNFSRQQIGVRISNYQGNLSDLEIISIEGKSLISIKNLEPNEIIPVEIDGLLPGTYFVRIVDQQTGKQLINKIFKL